MLYLFYLLLRRGCHQQTPIHSRAVPQLTQQVQPDHKPDNRALGITLSTSARKSGTGTVQTEKIDHITPRMD